MNNGGGSIELEGLDKLLKALAKCDRTVKRLSSRCSFFPEYGFLKYRESHG